MKKVFILLLIAIIALSLGITSAAHDGAANTGWGTAEIDGVKDAAYDAGDTFSVEQVSLGEVDESLIATAKVSTLWDGDYLYIFAEVTDSLVDSIEKSPFWDQDDLGFMIDFANDKENGFTGGEGSNGGWVNVLAIEGEGICDFGDGNLFSSGEGYADGVKAYCVMTDKGYNTEICIPLLYKDYVAGDAIGFELVINNGCGFGVRDSQTVWRHGENGSGTDAWKGATNLGTLTLLAAPVTAAEPEVVAEPVIIDEPAVVAEPAEQSVVINAPQTNDAFAIVLFAIGMTTAVTSTIKKRK